MTRKKGGQGGEGGKRERVEKVCLLDGEHEGSQIYVIDLEHLTSELLRCHVTSKEGAREQNRKQDRLLQ